jgi:hypothetical protein
LKEYIKEGGTSMHVKSDVQLYLLYGVDVSVCVLTNIKKHI